MSAMPHRLLRCLGTSLTILVVTSCAIAQSGDGGDGSDSDFRYYFSVTTDRGEKNRGRDWGGQIRFDNDIMSRDFVILYMHMTGNYPKAGPHLSTDPAYMQAHLEKLVLDLEKQIPDPNFSGIAILDYEAFRAVWDRVWNHPSDAPPDAIDEDFRDDWTDHIRATHPRFDSMSQAEQEQLLRETWEAAVKDLFLNSINKAREVRPNAQWGFYGYPYRFFTHQREAPVDVISYGDGTHHGSDLNDRLQWMWDAVDIIAPSVYPLRLIEDPLTTECDQIASAEDDLLYIENMIREAQRVGNGKPVMPFVAYKYYRRQGCNYFQDLNDANLWNQIMGPARLGADGVFLWGHVKNQRHRDHLQQYLDQRIMPLMAQGVAERGPGGSDESFNDEADNDDQSQDDEKYVTSTRFGGVVSKIPDRPSGPTESTRVSTRRSTRVPAIPFNPRTDRISKPSLTPEELRKAIRRAKEIRERSKEKDKKKDD